MGTKQTKFYEHGPVNQFEPEGTGKKPAPSSDGHIFPEISLKPSVSKGSNDEKKSMLLHPTKSWEPMEVEGSQGSPTNQADSFRSGALSISPAISKRRDSFKKKPTKLSRSGELKKRRHTTALSHPVPQLIETVTFQNAPKMLSPSSSGASLTYSMSVDEVTNIDIEYFKLAELPSEIWVHIFAFLSLEDKCAVSAVCKHWNEFIWASYTRIELRFRNRMDQEQIISNILKKTCELRELVLRDCFVVSGRIFEKFPASLQKFSFYNCPNIAKTTTNACVGKLPELLSLKLANCNKIDDDVVTHFPSSLKEIDLSGTCMTDLCLFVLPKDLEVLNLSNIPHNFRALNQLPKVESLVLQSTLSEDNSLQNLPESLAELDLSDSRFITDEGLKNLSELKNLKTLSLQDCNEVKGDFSSLPSSLDSLDLKNCQKLGSNGTIIFPPKLTSLSCWGCSSVNLTSDGGIALVKALPAFLQHLNLSQTKITDQAFSLLPTSLKSLALLGCSALTPSVLEFFPTLPYLEELDLSWTQVSNKSLESVAQKFPRLKKLKLAHCNQVSMEGALMLKNTMPSLQIFGSNGSL